MSDSNKRKMKGLKQGGTGTGPKGHPDPIVRFFSGLFSDDKKKPKKKKEKS